VLNIVHEHIEAIGGATRALHGGALLFEGKLELHEQLRDQIAEIHCVTRRSGLDADSCANYEFDEFPLLDDLEGETVSYQGTALETVAACGPSKRG
jgi:hypothetical protein